MNHKYYIIHKPYKILSQFTDENGNSGLGSIYQLPADVYPVGRLDLDSEGLLILTNDKSLNQRLLNPKFKHERTYLAQVEGIPSKDDLYKFASGLNINLGKGKIHHTLPAKIRILEKFDIEERTPPVNYTKSALHSWLEIKLVEGKNRQVRKMTAAIGHPTLRLIRSSIEKLQLANLASGQIQELSRG
ncbi:MAG: pseudouridine synthase, partial [Cyclobacteriaceae bacterium]